MSESSDPIPGAVPAGPGPTAHRRFLPGLVLLLALAFGLRLHHAFAMSEHPRFDAPIMDAGYHYDWAKAILAGQEFQPGAYFRAPLYPWFLALVLKLTGGSLFAVRIVQALLGTLATGLVWRIARREFGGLAGWVAGAIAATYWVSIYFDGELLIPTLYVPLLLLGLDRALLLPRRGFTPRAVLVCGAWFGLAALARPNVLLFMPLLFAWVWFQARPGRWRAGLLLTLGTLIPIAPVTARNYAKSGELVLIATQAGVNFWIGNNPDSDGVTALVPGTRAGWWEGYEDSRRKAREEAGRDLTDSGISRFYSDKAWAWMRAEPGAALRQLLWKLRLFHTNWEFSNNQEIRFWCHRLDPLRARAWDSANCWPWAWWG
ncbi:MAG: glycosyltransferase family 39 protein [Planctomycetota bacterium]